MLTTAQKASILRQTGFVVPEAPLATLAAPLPPDDAAPPPSTGGALQAWVHAIETLFSSYVAARAAKGLRDAQERSQLDRLREMASGSGTPRLRAR